MNATSRELPAARSSREPVRSDSRPWYRQGWLWFVIALPAISVAFSFATLYIALHNADEVVPHDGDSSSYSAPREPARGTEAAGSKSAAAPDPLLRKGSVADDGAKRESR